MKSIAFGLFLIGISISAGAKEPEALTLRVSPAVAFAPANLVVRAVIAANAANRTMEVVAESDDFYRSSEIELQGDRAPKTTQFEFRNLPQGSYAVTAILRDSTGEERASIRQQVDVLASGAGDR